MLAGVSDEYNLGLAQALEKKFDNELLRDLYEAYIQARRAKRRTNDEFVFEVNEMENLMLLKDDIVRRTYEPSRSIAFVIRKPVIREIFAAPFRDRIIHHLLYNIVYDWWDTRLNYDAYSCRVGKGTLFGINRLAERMRKVSQGYTREAYVIKLDIQGYFMSLPRDGLYKKVMWGLERQFPDGGRTFEMAEYLWRQVIFDDPCRGVKRRGGKAAWRDVPPSKSLFCQEPGYGIVIGNLSSQLLSNMYLDGFDRFVTRELKYKNYGRYVDDFYIVVTKEELGQALKDVEVMRDYLLDLKLTLHPNKIYIQEIHRGVPFLGGVVYPGYILPGKRIKAFFNEAVRNKQNMRTYKDSVQSYLGHMAHFDSKTFINQVFESMGWEFVY